MTWTTVEVGPNGYMIYRKFHGSHSEKEAWEKAKDFCINSELIAIIRGDHKIYPAVKYEDIKDNPKFVKLFQNLKNKINE